MNEHVLPLSLKPLDVGWDPRTVGTLIRLARAPGQPVDFLDADGNERSVNGHPQMVAETLARCGYSLVVGLTSNGRDVQCTPRSRAPVGDLPDHEWDGPAWAVQHRNDNFWIIRPTLADALVAARWKLSEIRWLSSGGE